MFKVWFTNFGYGSGESFDTFAAAVDFSRSKGFETTILNRHQVIVGSWSPLYGRKQYERDCDLEKPGNPAC